MIDTIVLGVSILAWLAIICIVVTVGALLIYMVLQDAHVVPRDPRGRFVARTTINRILTLLRGR